MKIHGYNFRGCWLTLQNENTILPNSWILFSHMLGKPQNLRKFPAIQHYIRSTLRVSQSHVPTYICAVPTEFSVNTTDYFKTSVLYQRELLCVTISVNLAKE